MEEKKDLVFECKTCGCLWQRFYVRELSSSPHPERFHLVEGQTPKACCENDVGYLQLKLHVTGEVDPRVHAGDPTYGGRTTFGWHSDGGCSYCGSLSVPEAVRLLRTPGTKFSGTDKTTYKAYIGEKKFYYKHLKACTDAELAEFDELSRKIFGISWKKDDLGELMCSYPRSGSFYGWQTYGHIGNDGAPVFHEGSPTPPGPDFWK